MDLVLNPYQAEFLHSDKRFPCMVSAIGTGKTYMLLLKVWLFCEKYPNSLALIIRKEFTDLRDSTLKDFERYFSVKPDSNKEYSFKNGSKIMFRHASELNVLKNINLSIAAIEQAEEFENDEQFNFLRDRLRRDNAPIQQLCVIANANGHNWIWRKWINQPTDEYHVSTATTFDNEHNLPKSFMDDLRAMEIDAPIHYRQFVMNDMDETGSDDVLMNSKALYESSRIVYANFGAYGRILAVDVARFGDDETVFSAIEKISELNFRHLHQETWRNKDLMMTAGKTLDLIRQLNIDITCIDDVGIGGGVTDRLREQKHRIQAFVGNAASVNPMYANARSEAAFILKEMVDRKQISIIPDNELMEQLMSLKYKYKSDGKKALVSKDEMRKEGFKSPDRADALTMAVYYKDLLFKRDNSYQGTHKLEFVNGASSYDFLKV